MIESIRAHDKYSTVYILALDELTKSEITKFDLGPISVISMADIEKKYPELEAVQDSRSRMEYVFTTTPYLFQYVFETWGPQYLCYVDADLYFFSSPSQIFAEIEKDAVGITPHDFKPSKERKLSKYGRFNAGFMVAQNVPQAIEIMKWWGQLTLEWCMDKPAEGKYANQGYLDQFPHFNGVKIISNEGMNAAPWNAWGRAISDQDGTLFAGKNLLCFYHFHGLKFMNGYAITSERTYGARLTTNLKLKVYEPYIRKLQLNEAVAEKKLLGKSSSAHRSGGLRAKIFQLATLAKVFSSIIAGEAIEIGKAN